MLHPNIAVVIDHPKDISLITQPYLKQAHKLRRAYEVAPKLVQQFIDAANEVEAAWASGDLAGAVRALTAVRDEAESYR